MTSDILISAIGWTSIISLKPAHRYFIERLLVLQWIFYGSFQNFTPNVSKCVIPETAVYRYNNKKTTGFFKDPQRAGHRGWRGGKRNANLLLAGRAQRRPHL
jgi:hypothetical protein